MNLCVPHRFAILQRADRFTPCSRSCELGERVSLSVCRPGSNQILRSHCREGKNACPARPRPPHRSCPPEISKRAWVVSQPSRAVGPIMHRIGESERGGERRGDCIWELKETLPNLTSSISASLPPPRTTTLLSSSCPSRRSGIPAHFLSTQTMNPVPFARYLSSFQGAIQIRKELLTRKVSISIKYDFNGGCSLKSR